jgi:hypothetical protein
MSARRKLARRQATDTRIAGNKHPNPVKEVMRRRKAIQQKMWAGQAIVSSLLKICGHYVATPRSMDQYHESLYVRGTTVSGAGLLPTNYETMYEGIRRKVRHAIKQGALAQEAVV